MGAGKSSLVHVLLRTVEPQGELTYLLEGRNALQMDLSSLKRKINVVSQQSFIFTASISKNIDPFAAST